MTLPRSFRKEGAMGQAKRNRENGIMSRRFRFIHLMRLISRYSDREISRFAENRKGILK